MIKISDKAFIREDEIKYTFIRASGPGGQNVNKVSTSVQLKFNVYKAKNISDDIKDKIIKKAGKRVNAKGELIIEAKRFRTQEKNKQDATTRLIKIITDCTKIKKKRKKTSPTNSSKEKRIEVKKLRADLKKQRMKIT